MFCKHCGNELTEGAIFCNKCGNKVMEQVVESKERMDSTQRSKNVDNKNEKSKKSVGIGIAIAIAIILITFVLLGVGIYVIMQKANKGKAEEARQAVTDFIDGYKEGNVGDVDLDEIYDMLIESIPEDARGTIEYFLVDEEVWNRVWKSTHETLEYEITSVEKQEDGTYMVTFTTSNKNIVLILVGTVSEMVSNGGETIAGAFLGTMSDQFMDEYEKQRDETNSSVTGNFQMHVYEDENGEMQATFENGEDGFVEKAIGISDKYLEED